MDAVPLFPSQVAVMVAVPVARPAITPLLAADATLGLLDDHVIVRPVSGVPAASLTVAWSIALNPRVTVAFTGVTTTEATGSTEAVPLLRTAGAV